MRNEKFYPLTTLILLALLAFSVLAQGARQGGFADIAFAEPAAVNCVKGKNGIKGGGAAAISLCGSVPAA